MSGLIHPFTGASYSKTDEGNVLVTDGERTGLFRRDGSWIEGELFECDPQICVWVSGPKLVSHRLKPMETKRKS
jgi:hypothetical protein